MYRIIVMFLFSIPVYYVTIGFGGELNIWNILHYFILYISGIFLLDAMNDYIEYLKEKILGDD